MFWAPANAVAVAELPVTLPIKSVSSDLFITNFVPVCEYVRVASAPSIVIPAPSAAELSAAPSASVMFRSSTFISAVLRVVVVPLTVKFPVTTNAPPTVMSSGSAILILLLLTVVAISFVVPSNVSVSVPTVTASFDPVSAAIVSTVGTPLTCEST